MHQSLSDYPKRETPVAANVRAEVARQDLSQQAVAELLGISQGAVSRRLAGRVDFSASELDTLARSMGIPVARFFIDTALAEGGDAA